MRVENNWKVTPDLNKKVEHFNLQTINTKDLIHKLLNFWETNRNKGDTLYEGIIETLLPNKKDGFIKCSDGNSYYFKGNSVNYKNYSVNQKVSFFLKDGFDRKKQRATKQAYSISLKE